MILQIGFDIRFFLIVLCTVLVGFAQGFWLLSYPDKSLTFGTIGSALLHCFLFMLGNFDSDFSGTASPAFATLLLVLFLLFMTILMLNLLIALMGQSFSAVSEKGLAQWRLEQATIILDQMFMTKPGELELAPYVYVLRYTSDLSKSIETLSLEEKLGARLQGLEERLDGLGWAVGEQLKSIAGKLDSTQSSESINSNYSAAGDSASSEAVVTGSGDSDNLRRRRSSAAVKDSTSNGADSNSSAVADRVASLESKFSSLDTKLDRILAKLQ